MTVPTSTVPGTYYLLVCADNPSKIIESIETNNCGASATTVAAGP
jgi:hypothetical protein